MYRDQFIEVALCVLVLNSYYLHFMGAIGIPIEDIDRVRRDFGSHSYVGQVRGGRTVAVPGLSSGVFPEFDPVSLLRRRTS